MHELALRTKWGDVGLMKEQYRRLLFRTHVLQIVSADISTFRSPLTLFEFEKAPLAAFTETDLLQWWVRDTKNASGPVLAFSTSAWRALLSSL
ncbi:DUF397 domain-containing protein [Lentzea sp. CA-135723]